MNGEHFAIKANGRAVFAGQLAILLSNGLIIGDARLRHKQPGDTAHMRLMRTYFVAIETPQALQSVGQPASMQLFQSGQLGFVHRDDDFAAAVVRDAVLLAEAIHRFAARDADCAL